MKRTQHMTSYGRLLPGVTEERAKPRPIRSTAAILARGVKLKQVQKAVEKLRPQVFEAG